MLTVSYYIREISLTMSDNWDNLNGKQVKAGMFSFSKGEIWY